MREARGEPGTRLNLSLFQGLCSAPFLIKARPIYLGMIIPAESWGFHQLEIKIIQTPLQAFIETIAQLKFLFLQCVKVSHHTSYFDDLIYYGNTKAIFLSIYKNPSILFYDLLVNGKIVMGMHLNKLLFFKPYFYFKLVSISCVSVCLYRTSIPLQKMLSVFMLSVYKCVYSCPKSGVD